jgi:hypothetical protein
MSKNWPSVASCTRPVFAIRSTGRSAVHVPVWRFVINSECEQIRAVVRKGVPLSGAGWRSWQRSQTTESFRIVSALCGGNRTTHRHGSGAAEISPCVNMDCGARSAACLVAFCGNLIT